MKEVLTHKKVWAQKNTTPHSTRDMMTSTKKKKCNQVKEEEQDKSHSTLCRRSKGLSRGKMMIQRKKKKWEHIIHTAYHTYGVARGEVKVSRYLCGSPVMTGKKHGGMVMMMMMVDKRDGKTSQ